jgi:hypothetical protein
MVQTRDDTKLHKVRERKLSSRENNNGDASD